MEMKLTTKILVSLLFLIAFTVISCWSNIDRGMFVSVMTINAGFGEPFGIASSNGILYVSDGQKGTISKMSSIGIEIIDGIDTPSGVCIGGDGKLVVADSGTHAIFRLDPNPTMIAGTNGIRGSDDGPALAAVARFNGPIGVACDTDKIYVADTYNDRIRVIENGNVRNVAGSATGFRDGSGALFDTPTGVAVWNDKVLVADTGNQRIRVVEPDGSVWTLAGNGESDLRDGSLLSASFVSPSAIAVSKDGTIYVADGNAIRMIGGAIPMVRTIAGLERGNRDGNGLAAMFNRPSGLAIDENGDLLIADSENGSIRKLTADTNAKATATPKPPQTAEEFRNAAPARWPFDPPTTKRDIAGTLGEIRGKMTPAADNVWFHNGLDVAGAYGETARFVRSEKVLRVDAAENFGTLRELIRMPTMGYIHIRLGRDKDGKLFGDERFQFSRDASGKLANVRVARGARFEAGDAIGTLNPMNHVHLIAGRSGREMNAIDALTLPGISDSRVPTIEGVSLFSQNWQLIETTNGIPRIKQGDQLRIVVRAYDQVDGNSERRRLGVYGVSYQLSRADAQAAEIKFDRMPSNLFVSLLYGNNSHSGATGETVFNYIATNSLIDGKAREGFVNTSTIEPGKVTATVNVTDYFGNRASKQIEFEVIK